MVALDAVGAAGVQKGCGSHDVGPDKGLRVCNGTVHMALGRKVYHHVRLFLLKQFKYKFPVGNVALYKFVVEACPLPALSFPGCPHRSAGPG